MYRKLFAPAAAVALPALDGKVLGVLGKSGRQLRQFGSSC